MKPRAMSVWIVAAASSAVSPCASVQARVSFSPPVKNVSSPAVSKRFDSTCSKPPGPSRNSAASSGDSSASSASSLRSMPPSPLTICTTGFIVRGSSSGGSPPSYPLSGPPASTCARMRSSSDTSPRSCLSPDLAIVRTRSRRFSTWSRSATTSSRPIVSRSCAGSASRPKPRSTASSASAFRSSPRTGALRPGGSTSLTVAGVVFAEPSTSAIGTRRSSGIGATPTCSCPYAVCETPVSAVKSVVFPAPGRPTIPTSSGTAQTVLRVHELSLERLERAALERLHGPFGLAEDPRRLRVAEAEHELQREHLALLGRKLLDQPEHPELCDLVERLLLRGRLLIAGRLGHLVLDLHPVPRPEVIHREVVRDSEEPCGEGSRLPAEVADRLEHPQKRLGREVLGVVAVAHADTQVAVDAIEMEEVELLERITIAVLCPLDDRTRVDCPAVASCHDTPLDTHPQKDFPGRRSVNR